jgi:hypothetical protein
LNGVPKRTRAEAERELVMDDSGLLNWQRTLIVRLEGALQRKLAPADFNCIAWNMSGEALIVEAWPLRKELQSRNLTSHIFRSQRTRRQ